MLDINWFYAHMFLYDHAKLVYVLIFNRALPYFLWPSQCI